MTDIPKFRGTGGGYRGYLNIRWNPARYSLGVSWHGGGDPCHSHMNIKYHFCQINCYPYFKTVYIRTSPEIAYQRVQKRERQEETSLTIEYLKKIHNIHEEWLYHQTLFKVPTPILIFDGNKNLEEMLSEVENCRNQIFSNQIFNKELEKKEAGDIIYAQSL